MANNFLGAVFTVAVGTIVGMWTFHKVKHILHHNRHGWHHHGMGHEHENHW